MIKVIGKHLVVNSSTPLSALFIKNMLNTYINTDTNVLIICASCILLIYVKTFKNYMRIRQLNETVDII